MTYDDGLGFHTSCNVLPAGALIEAMEEARGRAEDVAVSTCPLEPVGVPRRWAPSLIPLDGRTGEGIGLSIVKQRCALLDASLKLESKRKKDTPFRVVRSQGDEAAGAK